MAFKRLGKRYSDEKVKNDKLNNNKFNSYHFYNYARKTLNVIKNKKFNKYHFKESSNFMNISDTQAQTCSENIYKNKFNRNSINKHYNLEKILITKT